MVDRALRRREGTVLADALVGLTRQGAFRRIAAAGFDGVAIAPDDWLPGNDDFNRIRVWADEDGEVVRARAE